MRPLWRFFGKGLLADRPMPDLEELWQISALKGDKNHVTQLRKKKKRPAGNRFRPGADQCGLAFIEFAGTGGNSPGCFRLAGFCSACQHGRLNSQSKRLRHLLGLRRRLGRQQAQQHVARQRRQRGSGAGGQVRQRQKVQRSRRRRHRSLPLRLQRLRRISQV